MIEQTAWLLILPTVFVALTLIFLPGIVLGTALRLRGLWLWSLAPAISTTLITISSILLQFAGIKWSIVSVIASVVAVGASIYGLFRLIFRKWNTHVASMTTADAWPWLVGWVIAAIVLAWQFVRGVGSPESISQTFDNVFHLNAIAFILDSGSASPLTIGQMSNPDAGLSFYPTGWHAFVSILASVGGVSISTAVNAFNLASIISIWPLGVLVLTRQLAGNRPVALIAAGVLSAAFPMMPLNLMHYGVLYPYFFAMTLVPVALALLLQLLKLTMDTKLLSQSMVGILLAGVLGGIALVHPAAVMVIVALALIAAIVATFSGWTSVSTGRKVGRLAGLLTFSMVGFILMYVLRRADHWGPRTTTADALWQSFTLSLDGYGFPALTVVLLIIGVLISLAYNRKVGCVAVGFWVMATALYFVTVGVENSVIRFPTRIWYGDAPRLAAVIPIAVIPLAALGFSWVVNWVTSRIKGRKIELVVSSSMLLLLLITTQISGGYSSFLTRMSNGYSLGNDAALLSSDEYELLLRMGEQTDPKGLVVGNPWTGTSLAYALADREVLMPHILIDNLGPDGALVLNELRDATFDSEVCSAINRLNVRYVLDFGEQEVHGAKHMYSGLEGLETSSAVELLDEQGEARLYEVVACA